MCACLPRVGRAKGIGVLKIRWRPWFAVVAVLSVLHGCAAPEVVAPPVSESAKPATKPPAKEVVILVSENIQDYSQVAKVLAGQLGARAKVRYLKAGRAENIRMLAEFPDDGSRQFVSIGLKAAVAAKALENSVVVFCQVFNYQDYDLISSGHKGVSMIASLQNMFATWKALSPGVTDIGVISGPGMDDVMREATAAARNAGISLHRETVRSDTEYQSAFKQMAGQVQGYWLLPDNRVLSGVVLRDLMTFSVREGKQVVVHSKELLGLGGLFSAATDYKDIAQQIIARLNQVQGTGEIAGADVIYPGKLVLTINSTMVQRFNLTVPAQYRKYEHAY